MRKLLLASLLIFFCQLTFAQSPLKGTVKDTLEKKPLLNAVVTLIQKKDSAIYGFTRTDKEGHFQFSGVQPGAYTLLITYPKFADYADDITIKTEGTDLGLVPLTQKSQLLQTVIIKNTGAIRIKGDTTEFVADSFKVREGATVEELLKKLPGFQVNSKGEITAQGQKVQKVLVDGEEFFGDDPTMATKNIGAKAVDKIQVFDTKTDQQQLAGMTNGNDGKTVNIKLKEDQKKGGFGKYSAATDFNKYHEVNLLYNRFVGKRKLSVYGNKTNLSTGSLNWEDQRKLGIEDDYEFDEVSGYYMSFGSDDGFENWNLKGRPDAYTAGGLFSNKWAADQQSVNGSYRYNRLLTNNVGSTLTQNILPDTLFYNNQYTTSKNLNQQHAFNGKWEWKPDSLTTIKFTTATTRRNSSYQTSTHSEALSEERAYVNTGDRETSGTTSKWQSDNSLQYKRLFKKVGRQLIGRVRFNYIEDSQQGLLNYTNQFYKNNRIDSTETADQQKLNSGHSNTIGGKLTYSEPLSTKWAMIADYSYNLNNATSNRNTFDKSSAGKYELLNPRYSNNFDMKATSQAGSLIARYTTKKIRFAIGTGISSVQLNLLNKDSNRHTIYHFVNLTPQANFGYTIKQNNNINIHYSGSSVQPSIEQLQPLRNNNDPLNIFIGNPDLKVGFRHNINGSYNFYKVLSQMGLWSYFNYSTTQNAIAYSTVIDAGGRKTSQSVNVNGNRNLDFYVDFHKGEGPKKINPHVSLNGNAGTNVNFVNGARNVTDFYRTEFTLGGRYEVEDKWNIDLQPKIGYSHSISSLNKAATTSFLFFGGDVDGFLKLPGGLELSSDANFDLRQRISAFDANPNITLWNAELKKSFLKKKTLKVSLLAHDILNTYKGFERTISSNFIIEQRYQRVGQYFLLKLEWSFNKMGGGEQ